MAQVSLAYMIGRIVGSVIGVYSSFLLRNKFIRWRVNRNRKNSDV